MRTRQAKDSKEFETCISSTKQVSKAWQWPNVACYATEAWHAGWFAYLER